MPGARALGKRPKRVGLAGLAALFLAFGQGTPASAYKIHPFQEVFGSAAQPNLIDASSIAVDQSNGDVLILDYGPGGSSATVNRYHPDGTPDPFPALGTNVIDGKGSGQCPTVPADCDQTSHEGFGISAISQVAIDNSGGPTDGNIYVAKGFPYVLDIFSSAGKYLGQLSEAAGRHFSRVCGVAVDSVGAVYVGDESDGIHKFTPSGNPPANVDNVANFDSLADPCSLAAGSGASAGFLFAISGHEGPIAKLDSSSGALEYTVSAQASRIVTVDPASGHLYAARDKTVDELDASGAFTAAIVSSTPTAGTIEGLGVRGANGNIYVSHPPSNVEVYGSALIAFPALTSEPASAITDTTATLNGTVNPEGVALSECVFEWGTSTAYGETAPCVPAVAEIGAGTSARPVHVDLSGLSPGTVYHYRLRGANPNGPGVPGSDVTFKAKALEPPALSAEAAAGVTFTEASLGALINPEGQATSYRFEWGTDASYGHQSAQSFLGFSDKQNHAVAIALKDLSPGTSYHWRIIATNLSGTSVGQDHLFSTYTRSTLNTDCPNQQFRTGPAAALPDCRAYELVSPVEKTSSDLVTATSFGGPRYLSSLDQSSTSGQKLTYSAYRAFGDALGAPYSVQYIASRGVDGWQSHSITPARGRTVFTLPLPPGTEFKAFLPDLSSAWLVHNADPELAPGAVEGFINLYRRDNLAEIYEALTTVKPPHRYSSGYSPEFQGASRDGGKAIFRVPDELTSEAPPDRGDSSSVLYEWVGGELHLVGVLPNGQPSPMATSAGRQNGSLIYGAEQSVDHAISADGSRVFWTAQSPSLFEASALYVRVHPDRPQSPLALGSGAGSGDLEAGSPLVTNLSTTTGTFQVGQSILGGSIPPGTTIAAVGTGTLTLSASATFTDTGTALEAFSQCTEPEKACTIPVSESASNADARFVTASADGTKVVFMTNESPGGQEHIYPTFDLYEFDVETETPTLIAHEAAGVLGASDDLSYLYFASREDLDAGATPGKANLYLYRAGDFSFIATLPDAEADAIKGGPNPLHVEPPRHLARVTPDGRHAAFVSAGSPTGFDNTDPKSGEAAAEVYLYDADTDQLICPSCNPSGARPIAAITKAIGVKFLAAGSIPGWKSQLYDGRVLSDDGKHLFFNSVDALVPEDTNGAMDVYQWEAQGSGDCQRADGCLSLLSTGKSTSDSEFIDASPSGDDIFIRTESGIDPRDPGLLDIYDVRVDGGFPYLAPVEGCIGDACQNPQEAPRDPTPASAAFKGAGNLRHPCRAAKVGRKQGRRARGKRPKRCRGRRQRARR